MAVEIPQHKSEAVQGLSKLKSVVKVGRSMIAGNASGIDDVAAALLIASNEAVQAYNLKRMSRSLLQQWWGRTVHYRVCSFTSHY